ncbi:MAG: hypothetical protein U0Y68_16130 [Blastocatellia bacterium]
MRTKFAIKLMETCYVIAELAFRARTFLPGPIAMIERGFPVFVFAPPGPTLPERWNYWIACKP